MRSRSRPALFARSTYGAVTVWVIALLIARVATIQLRSQAEVEKSLQSADAASLAFSIDQLHRANDSLEAQITDLTQQQRSLQSGGAGAADQVLTAEANDLRIIEGLVPVHGPGVVVVIDAPGLTALDLQDALNSLSAGGGEAFAVNGERVVVGLPIVQTGSGLTVGGSAVYAPWTIVVIGDTTRLAETADLMTQQLRGDRRVREASYRVEADIVIRAVVSERPFVYALP
jgi:uncharacterized protein YlxW (UPF0749 family)